MIKNYLVPVVGDGVSIKTAFRPKYLKELGLNHSLVDLRPEFNVFLVIVNTRDSSKISSLESNADVVDITTNTKAVRTKIKELKNLDIVAGENVVEKIARTKVPDFTKDKISVSSD